MGKCAHYIFGLPQPLKTLQISRS